LINIRRIKEKIMKIRSLSIVLLFAMWSSLAIAKVELPEGGFHLDVTEMSIKTADINLNISRSWYRNFWVFNANWQDLTLKKNSLSGHPGEYYIVFLSRGRDVYSNVGNGIFLLDERKRIIKTDTGFRWIDRDGQWINYNEKGQVIDFGYRDITQGVIVRDSESRISGLKDAQGTQLLFINYHSNGRVSEMYDNSSPARRVSYQYEDNKLIEAIDVLGNSRYYTYYEIKYHDQLKITLRMASYTDAMGNKTTISYHLNGRPKDIVDQNNIGWNYVFDYDKVRKSYYVRQLHSSGRSIETWYDKDAQLLRKDINGENTEIIERSLDNIKDTLTNRRNLKTIKDYDIHRNLIKTTYPDGSVSSQKVDTDTSNITEKTDEAGIITQFHYTPQGYLSEKIEAVGTAQERHTLYQRNTLGQVTQITQPADNVTAQRISQYQYDTSGNLTQETDALGHITDYTYNNAGNRLTQTRYTADNSPVTTTYTYNAMGWFTQMTRPDGQFTQYQYDANGNQIKQIDFDSNQSQISQQSTNYDYRNNRISHTDSLGHTTTYTYDSRDNLLSITDADGNSQTLKYDLYNRITDRIDASGYKTSYIYGTKGTQTAGLLTQTTYPSYSDNRLYDKRGRMLSKQLVANQNEQSSSSQSTRYQYNATGKLTQTIDAKNRSTQYQYDDLGRLIKSTDNQGKVTSYSYDNRDNILSVTDANGHTIRSYQYDANNQNIKESKAPIQGQTAPADTMTYNALGLLQSSSDAMGHISRYTYNSNQQLITLERFTNASTSTPDNTITFNYNPQGQLASYTDNNSSATYQYNQNKQKISETINYTQGSFSKNYQYSYNATGKKSRFTDAQNLDINYSYNSNQQIAQIHIANTGFLTYNYSNGKLDQLSLPGDSQQYWRYDAFERPEEILVQDPATIELDKRGYSYDTVNNIIQQSIREGVLSYQYNNLDRLTQVNYQQDDNLSIDSNHNQTYPPNNESYNYDAVGNRISSHKTTGNWAYNDNNELQSYTEQSQSFTFQHNANGQLIQKTVAGQTTYYDYNLAGRLKSIKDNQQQLIASYTYDPFGRRISKTVYDNSNTPETQTTTYYFYSEEGLIGEYNQEGELIQSYGYAPDSPFSTNPIFSHRPDFTDAGGYVYYINDHLGTPKKLLTNTGRVVWFGQSDAFGQTQLVKSEYRNPLRFPGQYEDEESGLFYNYFRYYDPELGRYITSDPIGLEGGINTYAYVGGNPLNYIDPTGEISTMWIIIGVAVYTGYTVWDKIERQKQCELDCEKDPKNKKQCDAGDTSGLTKCKSLCVLEIWSPTFKKAPYPKRM
jgi:RHS repeat-associated protein